MGLELLLEPGQSGLVLRLSRIFCFDKGSHCWLLRMEVIYYDLHCLKVPHNKEKDAQKIVKEEKLKG